MAWSEWKDFGEGAKIVLVGSYTTGANTSKTYDISTLTDKYSELTRSNFLVVTTAVDCSGSSSSTASIKAGGRMSFRTTVGYEPGTGTLTVGVTFTCTITGVSSSVISKNATINIYLVY